MKIMFNILFIINTKKNIIYYLFKLIDFYILYIYILLYKIFKYRNLYKNKIFIKYE